MKTGRSYIITALVTMCLFTITAYTACIKDACNGIVCANEGVCVEGRCTCPAGYEGDRCDTEWNKKFAGTWHATDKYLNAPAGDTFKYDITITGAKDSFYVQGLMDTLAFVKCKYKSLYMFNIVAQVIDSNITINDGRGTFDINTQKITGFINFRLRDTLYKKTIYTNYPVLKEKLIPVKIDTTMTTYFSWTR